MKFGFLISGFFADPSTPRNDFSKKIRCLFLYDPYEVTISMICMECYGKCLPLRQSDDMKVITEHDLFDRGRDGSDSDSFHKVDSQ